MPVLRPLGPGVPYSTTLSAVASKVDGTVSPSCFCGGPRSFGHANAALEIDRELEFGDLIEGESLQGFRRAGWRQRLRGESRTGGSYGRGQGFRRSSATAIANVLFNSRTSGDNRLAPAQVDQNAHRSGRPCATGRKEKARDRPGSKNHLFLLLGSTSFFLWRSAILRTKLARLCCMLVAK